MKNTILGQYGKSEDGEKPGYKEDDTVPEDSRCATFCTTVAYVKNARWEGVPFILKAGKGKTHHAEDPRNIVGLLSNVRGTALTGSKTEIRIQLKDTTAAMLNDTMHNELIIQVQPKEGVHLSMNAKAPELALKTIATELDLTYKDIVENPDLPEAYEALLRDAIEGDFSLSVREDELEASWKIWTPLLKSIDEDKEIIPEGYAYGEFPLHESRKRKEFTDEYRLGWPGEVGRVRKAVSVSGREAMISPNMLVGHLDAPARIPCSRCRSLPQWLAQRGVRRTTIN